MLVVRLPATMAVCNVGGKATSYSSMTVRYVGGEATSLLFAFVTDLMRIATFRRPTVRKDPVFSQKKTLEAASAF